jgi:hypothetical protein
LLLLALTGAYAPRPAHRTAARYTLRFLLRLVPWYPDARSERVQAGDDAAGIGAVGVESGGGEGADGE